MSNVVEFGKLALARLRLSLPLVGSESVIELVDHLRLVQRRHDSSVLLKSVAAQQPPCGGELAVGPEELRMRGHVERPLHESQAPRIPVWVPLPPEYARAAVHRQVDVGVAT